MNNISSLRFGTYDQTEILKAVNDQRWQSFRVSLLGLSTTKKVEMLFERAKAAGLLEYRGDSDFQALKHLECVRITNYINALLRGGQLKHKGGEIVIAK